MTAVGLILISAGASFFFALAEAALLSLSKYQAHQLAERHPRAGAVVARLLEQPQDLLATMAARSCPKPWLYASPNAGRGASAGSCCCSKTSPPPCATWPRK